MTAEDFARLIISDRVNKLIACVRRMRAEGKDRGADIQKRQLPLLVFCAAGFDPTPAASDSSDKRRTKGQMGRWRVQGAVHLNGLYMLDIDHLETAPRELVGQWLEDYKAVNAGAASLDEPTLRAAFFGSLGVLLVHVTSSLHGLRLVAIADKERGNLFDNALWLAKKLGVNADEACKDASRGSYAPSFNDIIYINKEKLFTYENPDYDKTFGPLYRGGHSAPTAGADKLNGNNPIRAPRPALPATGTAAQPQGEDGPDAETLDGHIKEGYHGASYRSIIDAWIQSALKREVAVGERHQVLLRMAGHLRYLANNNARFLQRVLLEHPLGAEYAREDPADFANITASACGREILPYMPKALLKVLEDAGVQLGGNGDVDGAETAAGVDYEQWSARLEPLLGDSPGLREAVMHLPRHHWMGALMAASAMLGTYLTRTWWEHFDGRYYRLSFIVYIIGQAASGKSFLTELDQLLMAPMQAADRLGRQAEEQYNEACKRRKSNEKAPEQPKIPVRYCPTSTSNAVFFRRLRNAVDPEVIDPTTGEPLRMHIITVESELKTATREWKKGYAAKGDLELKAFHNELAGVDYANIESANGIVQVNWNEVMSGTLDSLADKVKPSTILDGFVTRLALFLMPDNDYQMIERRKAVRNVERDAYLRQLGIRLEQVKGELHVPRLVDFCYDYEADLTRQADLEQDRCLDYFRKRIPVLMMRFTLVRIVLRQLDAAIAGKALTVDDSDLEFARLIGDFCLQMQVHMFGEMVMEALEREQESFKPRRLYKKTAEAFEKLGSGGFNKEKLVELGLAKEVRRAAVMLAKWLKRGYISKDGDMYYKI